MASHDQMPKYHELMNPLLAALHELGGSGSIEEISSHVSAALDPGHGRGTARGSRDVAEQAPPCFDQGAVTRRFRASREADAARIGICPGRSYRQNW